MTGFKKLKAMNQDQLVKWYENNADCERCEYARDCDAEGNGFRKFLSNEVAEEKDDETAGLLGK